jgi:predicted O-methyltransferase YrrM
VELGTCVGVSSAYQAAALAMNGRGRLVTLEGYAKLAEVARENFASLGLGNGAVVLGMFTPPLGPDVQREPEDYASVYGHHDEAATQRYFEMLLDAADDDALCVFDDINWSPGMQRAWRRIAAHERVDWSTSHERRPIALREQAIDGEVDLAERARADKPA